MHRRNVLTSGVAFALACGVAKAGAAGAPASWDGLVKVPSKRMDGVYLRPGADFRPYTKVMLDPTEVAFEKNWLRDTNRETRSLDGRISESDLEKIIAKGVVAASDLFAQAWTEGGYPVVTEPGPDTLRLRTAILDIRVSAPDRMTAGRSYTASEDAGSAILVLEARDSVTNALMGRAVDGRVVGDNTMGWRNSVTNQSDFRQEVKRWAGLSVRGLAELKALSPINESGQNLK